MRQREAHRLPSCCAVYGCAAPASSVHRFCRQPLLKLINRLKTKRQRTRWPIARVNSRSFQVIAASASFMIYVLVILVVSSIRHNEVVAFIMPIAINLNNVPALCTCFDRDNSVLVLRAVVLQILINISLRERVTACPCMRRHRNAAHKGQHKQKGKQQSSGGSSHLFHVGFLLVLFCVLMPSRQLRYRERKFRGCTHGVVVKVCFLWNLRLDVLLRKLMYAYSCIVKHKVIYVNRSLKNILYIIYLFSNIKRCFPFA